MSDTPTPNEEELMDAYLAAAYNYGSGPGFLSADENTFKRADERLNYYTDIMKAADLYPQDILGIQPAPEDPGVFAEPEIFQSDLLQTYAANPVMAQAMELIATGQMDPVQLANNMWANSQLDEDDPQYVDPNLLPTRIVNGQFQGQTEQVTDLQGLVDVFTDYAGDVARTQRETAAADRARDEHNTRVAEYEGYFRPETQADRMGGYRTELDFLDELLATGGVGARRLDPARLPATDDELARANRDNAMTKAEQNFGLYQSNPDNEFKRRLNEAIIQGGVRAANTRGPDPAAVAKRDAQAAQRAESNRAVSQMLGNVARARAAGQNRVVGPSQQELDNRRVLEFIYANQFGESPR